MVHALKLIYKDEVLRMLDPGRNDFYLKQAKFSQMLVLKTKENLIYIRNLLE